MFSEFTHLVVLVFFGFCGAIGVAACSSSHAAHDGGTGPDASADAVSDGLVTSDGFVCSPCSARPEVDVIVVLQADMALNSDSDTLRPLSEELATLSVDYDVRVGVVSPDLGSGRSGLPDCTAVGGRAILEAGIDGMPFVVLTPGTDAATLTMDMIRRVRAPNCFYDQSLESMLLSLSDSDSGLMPVAGQARGDRENAGFLRTGSFLTVIMMSDVNDCSTSNLGLYDPWSLTYDSELSLRCFAFPEALMPIRRYVDGLLALRNAAQLGFFVFGGVPSDLDTASYDEMLADERMRETIDVRMPSRIRPSCTNGHNLFPPVRQIATAKALQREGVSTAVGSACDPSRTRGFAPLGALVRGMTASCCPG